MSKFSLKLLGHAFVVVILGSLTYVAGDHIPALSGILHMTVQGLLMAGVTWAYAHFGITPTVIKAVQAGHIG